MISLWILVPGAVVGLGVGLAIRELRPAPPDLGSALERLAPRARTSLYAEQAEGPPSLDARIIAFVARIPSIRIPRKDLALLGQLPQDYLRLKITMAFLGVFMPLILTAGLLLMGVALPIPIPLGLCLGLGALLWLAPNQEIAQKARNARIEFRHAAAAYLDLVALQRAGDAGPSEALERAAKVGDGWAFLRIQDALARARAHGVDPWVGLKDLSDELQLSELADVADIVELAGVEGAAVYGTLRSRAASLRTELLAAERDKANTDSERLVVPGTFLVLLMVLFLTLPAMSRIFSSA